MRDLSDKISYLHGLCEGLNICESSPQGKITIGILEVLDVIADELSLMRAELKDFKEYIECIDNDLFELEENLWEDDQDIIELKCSKCGEELYFEADILDDEDVIEIICPECNEVVFIHDGSFDYDAYVDDLPDIQNHTHS